MKVHLSFQTAVLHPLLDLPELLEQVLHFVDDYTVNQIVLVTNKKYFGDDHFILNTVSFWKERASCNLNKLQDGMERKKTLRDLIEANTEEPKDYILKLRKHLYKAFIDDAVGEDDSTYSLEASPSNRAKCRLCRKHIDFGIIRFCRFTQATPTTKHYYDLKEYFHLTCLNGVMLEENPEKQKLRGLQVLNSMTLPYEYSTDPRFLKVVSILKNQYVGKKNIQHVIVCDTCGRINTGKCNYHMANNLDQCELCHNENLEGEIAEDISYTFTCCKCQKNIRECMFHCQICTDNHDICEGCFTKLLEEENTCRMDTTDHPFFVIGSSQKYNPLKRKTMDTPSEMPEPIKQKTSSLLDIFQTLGQEKDHE